MVLQKDPIYNQIRGFIGKCLGVFRERPSRISLFRVQSSSSARFSGFVGKFSLMFIKVKVGALESGFRTGKGEKMVENSLT